jgi:hypothetical protein
VTAYAHLEVGETGNWGSVRGLEQGPTGHRTLRLAVRLENSEKESDVGIGAFSLRSGMVRYCLSSVELRHDSRRGLASALVWIVREEGSLNSL